MHMLNFSISDCSKIWNRFTKTEIYLSLEARMKCSKEGMFGSESKNPFFCHGAIHIIILDDDIFLEHLYSIHFIRWASATWCLSLCKHHLAKATLTQNFDEVEVFQTNSTFTATTTSLYDLFYPTQMTYNTTICIILNRRNIYIQLFCIITYCMYWIKIIKC